MLNSSSINFDSVKENLYKKGYIRKSNQGRFIHQTHILGARVNCIVLNIIEDTTSEEILQEEFEILEDCPFYQ